MISHDCLTHVLLLCPATPQFVHFLAFLAVSERHHAESKLLSCDHCISIWCRNGCIWSSLHSPHKGLISACSGSSSTMILQWCSSPSSSFNSISTSYPFPSKCTSRPTVSWSTAGLSSNPRPSVFSLYGVNVAISLSSSLIALSDGSTLAHLIWQLQGPSCRVFVWRYVNDFVEPWFCW
jgi:hypothetical protein